MEIKIINDYNISKSDISVVIDVYSFSTTIPSILTRNVNGLYAINGSVDDANNFADRVQGENILVGFFENAVPPSPALFYREKTIKNIDPQDANFIYKSSNGSQLLFKSVNNSNLTIIGSFVNAKAIVDFIKKQTPNKVNLICAGYLNSPAIEDEICAKYIKYLLENDFDSFEMYKDLIIEMFRGKYDGDFFPRQLKSPAIEMLGFALRRSFINIVPVVSKVDDIVYRINKI
jgi:2-phosphosulfolactate phosphatase